MRGQRSSVPCRPLLTSKRGNGQAFPSRGPTCTQELLQTTRTPGTHTAPLPQGLRRGSTNLKMWLPKKRHPESFSGQSGDALRLAIEASRNDGTQERIACTCLGIHRKQILGHQGHIRPQKAHFGASPPDSVTKGVKWHSQHKSRLREFHSVTCLRMAVMATSLIQVTAP